jgi:hypothetical protein
LPTKRLLLDALLFESLEELLTEALYLTLCQIAGRLGLPMLTLVLQISDLVGQFFDLSLGFLQRCLIDDFVHALLETFGLVEQGALNDSLVQHVLPRVVVLGKVAPLLARIIVPFGD